jgi:hypothetical protein
MTNEPSCQEGALVHPYYCASGFSVAVLYVLPTTEPVKTKLVLPQKKKIANLDRNRTYEANLISLEGIKVRFMVIWLLRIKMFGLAVSWNQSLRCQVNNMGKTSIISLKHGKRQENRSAPDMTRFPVPFFYTILSHWWLIEGPSKMLQHGSVIRGIIAGNPSNLS